MRSTHRHSKPVVWEDLGHKVEEVVIVLVEHDGLESDAGQQRLQRLREFALDSPILFRDSVLELINESFEFRRERFLKAIQ